METIILYIFMAENIIIFLIVLFMLVKLAIMDQKLKNMIFSKTIANKETDEWRQKLLDKVKEKINITEQAQTKITRGEDLVAQFIYSHNDIQELSKELFAIFKSPIQAIRTKYPDLTDLDLLVLSLLGIGMDNDEICTLLRMEKRTLYRRRQLISQRINMSSTQLETFATTLLINME